MASTLNLAVAFLVAAVLAPSSCMAFLGDDGYCKAACEADCLRKCVGSSPEDNYCDLPICSAPCKPRCEACFAGCQADEGSCLGPCHAAANGCEGKCYMPCLDGCGQDAVCNNGCFVNAGSCRDSCNQSQKDCEAPCQTAHSACHGHCVAEFPI